MKINFNKTSIMLFAGISGSVLSCQSEKKKEQQEETKRPNIIFVMTDDHAYQAIGAYGSNRNETPNIDRLAEEGMIFNRATVTNSISSPSRAVILTGKHSHKNGVLDNILPFDSTQQTFPKLLQKSGYQTAMIGKWHLKSEPTGFDYWNILPGQGVYYNPDFKTKDTTKRITGYVTDVITDIALDWLKKKRNPDKPFLMMYHHKAPHRGWWPGPKHLQMYEDKKFPEPKTLFDDYKNRGTAAKEQEMEIYKYMAPAGDLKLNPDSVKKYDIVGTSKWGRNQAYYWNPNRFTEEQQKRWNKAYAPRTKKFFSDIPTGKKAITRWKYQAYMTDYLRCVASVDDNLGRLLNYLDKSGLAENTIVVYTSDQGFYLGEHGWFDKRFIYKESFRTPLLIRWPGVVKPGSESDRLVQNLDFAETFLDVAGVEIPGDMQGRSLVPILKGQDTIQWRDALYYHYYEYPGVHAVKRHYGITTNRYKLIHFYYDIDEWELYDLKKDPHELNNVYNEQKYQDVVKRMHSKLDSIQDVYGDSDSLRNVYLEKYLNK